MRALFLDIDGVLNCQDTPNPRNFPYIVDDKLLDNLKELVRRTGAHVILSSTWRTDPIGLLAAKHFGIPFSDIAPDMPGSSRCDEMLHWLAQHDEVDRYAVLDDDSDCLDDFPLFQPNPKTGLTMPVVEGAERYLKGETDETMRRPAIVRLGQNIKSVFKRDKS